MYHCLNSYLPMIVPYITPFINPLTSLDYTSYVPGVRGVPPTLMNLRMLTVLAVAIQEEVVPVSSLMARRTVLWTPKSRSALRVLHEPKETPQTSI